MVGLQFGKAGEPPLPLARVPVSASDATHMEAMGPALASLFLAAITPQTRGRLTLTGDSEAIVDLLNCSSSPANLLCSTFRSQCAMISESGGTKPAWSPAPRTLSVMHWLMPHESPNG